MSQTTQDALLLQTYEAVGMPARWDGLLGQWATALEADSGLLFTPGDQFNDQPMHGHEYDFETARDYGEYFHLHDDWTLTARSRGLFQAGHTGSGEAIVPQNRLRRSLFYNDFLRRMGQEWLLCSVLFPEGNSQAMPETVLSFYRCTGRRAFGRGATTALQRAVPHLQRCLLLHHELLRARSDRSLIESCLDQLGVGMVMLHADGRVQFANRQAEAALNAVPTHRSAAPPVLPVLQQLDRRARQGQYTSQRLSTAQGPLFAMSTPGQPAALGDLKSRAPGPVIWLIGARHSDQGALPLAAKLFGLTPAEQKVLSLLMQDQTPRQIAQTLDLQLSTVRTQLSALLQKTGARRQQELLRLIAAFPNG